MVEFDGNGVRLLYANNGAFTTFDGASNGGTRWDCQNPPLNAEFTGYFQGGSSDDMACKGRGGRHSSSDSCQGCCYIPACETGGGQPGYRTECPHDAGPTYGDAECTIHASCQSFSSFKGMKWVVWNTASNCVHWELWQDTTGNVPGNWVKLASRDDCSGDARLSGNCGGGPLLKPRGGSNVFTFRADGGPTVKWLSAVEIQPGGAPAPGTPGPAPAPIPGGTGTPPSTDPNAPGGDGGGGGGNDNNTGTGGGASAFAGKGCAIATAGGTTVTAGKCGGTGEDLLPGPGSGNTPAGGATEPKPFVTVFKDCALLYNIRTDLFDNCTISGTVTDNFKQVYQVSPIQNEYILMFGNSTTRFYGVKLHSSKSSLYKKRIRKLDVVLNRENPGATLSGDIVAEIRDIMGNVIYEFEDTVDAATVNLGEDVTVSFEGTDNTHQLMEGDMIVIHYDGGDSTNYIKVAHAPGQDSIDGFNTVFCESQSGISWDVDQLADGAFTLYE